jgi:vacuolar iron transporter family protein
MKIKAKDSLQTEIDAHFIYSQIANQEKNEHIKEIFQELALIELWHAESMFTSMKKKWSISPSFPFPKASFQARILDTIGKYFGYDYVIQVMVGVEQQLAKSDTMKKYKSNLIPNGSEENHVHILKNLLSSKSQVTGEELGRLEWKHKSIGWNALRAWVLWANDGLVSNMSLVMWVAWATGGKEWVLLAGIAGLMAWALSMALWEWISVKSSQELYERQMQLEMDEIEHNPDWEEKELALIYMSKGIEKSEAQKIAKEVMKDSAKAHTILVKEELWINTDDIEWSPMEAALSSFVFFIIWAIIPVFPFFFFEGNTWIFLSLIGSAFWLFIIGSSITLFTGKSIWYSGLRQVLFW